jgi:hypothetical protein
MIDRFWIGEVHSKRELGLNPKPHHFKPFEYFDHTGLREAGRSGPLSGAAYGSVLGAISDGRPYPDIY